MLFSQIYHPAKIDESHAGGFMPQLSTEYVQHVSAGPFPGKIDPWAEAGRYFHQLHGEIISHLISQIHQPLLLLGYLVGRETSLQIAEGSQPDIYIQQATDVRQSKKRVLDYPGAAAAVMAEPGIALAGEVPEFDALYIKEIGSSGLVTIVEIISPSNKTEISWLQEYQARRERRLQEGVHIVEIDLTRSIRRMVQDALVKTYPYHMAIHLSDQPARFIGIEWGEPLKRFAIPLRTEVIAVELQDAYNHAYAQLAIALHIQNEVQYSEKFLPFPLLMPPTLRQELLDKVQQWQEKLKLLMENTQGDEENAPPENG